MDPKAGNRTQLARTSIVELVAKAFTKAGWTQKEAGLLMHYDEGNISRPMMASGSLPVQRLDLLPDAFWREFIPLLADRHGLSVKIVDRRKALLTNVVTALQELLTEEAKD